MMSIHILRDDQMQSLEGVLYCDEGKISFIKGTKIKVPQATKYIVPGFIDRHTHGGYGVDYMDANLEGNENLLKQLAKEGITTVLPTTMTMDYADIDYALSILDKYSQEGVKCGGIHLEGPYLNIEKIGAQNPKYLKKPDSEYIKKHACQLQVVSYAPELDPDLEFLKTLNAHNIKGSVVHSNANVEQLIDSYKHGLNSFSHFYNGSSAYTHRNPGVINAGLGFDNTFLELICDGIHVDPFVVQTTYKLKGNDAIVLITDSMRAKGLNDGEYDLGGQRVILKDNQVRLKSGSLAGSVLTMDRAVRNYAKYTNCSVEEAIKAATSNVARSLGRTDIGYISEGQDFDVVMLDENLNILQVYVNGKIKYCSN